ncbi:MAG: archaea-specific SMC-related protein [Halobacteriales archaeon]
MDQSPADPEHVRVAVENVGGIDASTVEFSPGVTLLAGRNATNRTSFLRAIMAAVGSDDISLKADADEGAVELALGDARYTRTLTRRNGSIATGGEPYLDGDDVELADLFAFLLETNDARRAIDRDDDLREVVMRPVDTAAIEADIERLQAEKRELQEELDALDQAEDRRDRLETERAEREAELESLREELAAVEDELASADVEESRETESALEATLEELRSARNDLERVRHDLETERESVEALAEERAELAEELDDLAAVDDDELERIDEELRRLRDRKQAVDSTVSTLQQVIRFNEETLEGRPGVFADLGDAAGGDLTDQLVADGEQVTCWTCGTAVGTDQIAETVDRLRELSASTVEERADIAAEIDDLEDERAELEDRRERRTTLEDRLDRIEGELADGEARIERLRERREELEATVEELEADVDAFEDEEFGETLELHREASRLEVEADQLAAEVERLDEELDELDERLEERETLEDRRAAVQAELEDRRTRIERIEARAVEAFNDRMEAVLERLGYENIDRIWIERVERDAGGSGVAEHTFEIHVVRRTDGDTFYEDDVAHLSESEREVTGLVFALAGNLAHEVHETVPFMLLDSLEALDSERIAALVDYFEDYVEYLVVALLPEDAAALDDDYERIESI